MMVVDVHVIERPTGEAIPLFTAFGEIDTRKMEREVDKAFIRHLHNLHFSMGKPLSEMWPCHRERLLAMAGAQAVNITAVRPNPEGVTR